MPRAAELTRQIRAAGPRPTGSDAERRSAVWVQRQISTGGARTAEVETFWSRPNWAGAQIWHITLAVAGSLLATTQSRIGAALIFLALVSILADWLTCRSPGRLLTRERASQNILSPAPHPRGVHLVLTAELDTGRLDLDHPWRLPGWLFWIVAATAWALVIALLRIEGQGSELIAVLQLIPTVGLILAAAGLLLGQRARDNAGGVAAVLTLVRILDAAPPANLAVDLVLTGAGSGDGLGLRRHLRRRRRTLQMTNTVVLGFDGTRPVPEEPDGPLTPGPRAGDRVGDRDRDDAGYLRSDGPLLPLACFEPLGTLAEGTGRLTPRRGRGCSPALPGRLRRLPSLSLTGDPDQLVDAALDLIDAVDAYVADRPT